MTSPFFPAATVARRVTYARARLYLGITGVGSAVLAAFAVLRTDFPTQGFSSAANQPLAAALVSIGLLGLFTTIAFLMFDLIGGAWLVRRRTWANVWLKRWARGAAVQWCVWMVSAALLLVTARVAGVWAAVGAFAAIQLVLAATRGRMARVVAALTVRPLPDALRTAAQRAGLNPARITVVDTDDEGFVGGWSGIRARELIVPLQWTQLPEPALVAALTRRQLIATSGAHTRGVLGAIGWNTAGVAVVVALSAWWGAPSLATAAGIVTLIAGMTLWGFLGVLLLPTPSRAAVYAIDAAAVKLTGAPALRDAIERLDRWQDDEPTRSKQVETIFHPVPARSGRLARLAKSDTPVAGATGPVSPLALHHLARHALWLSWGALTPLSRVVHCNVGRPELWVMLPGD